MPIIPKHQPSPYVTGPASSANRTSPSYRKLHRLGGCASKHAFPRYPNLVDDPVITRPDKVWIPDITYIRLREEFIYLAVTPDVFTRIMRAKFENPSANQLCPANLIRLLHHVPLNLNMGLVAHSLKKNPYPISIFHFSLEYSREIFQRTVLHYYLITRTNILVNFDEAIFFYIRLNQCDDSFIDRGRAVAETDHAVNTSGETNFMI